MPGAAQSMLRGGSMASRPLSSGVRFDVLVLSDLDSTFLSLCNSALVLSHKMAANSHQGLERSLSNYWRDLKIHVNLISLDVYQMLRTISMEPDEEARVSELRQQSFKLSQELADFKRSLGSVSALDTRE